jgi:hypothetical protein
LRYINWYQSLDYPGLIANDGNNGNHSDGKEHGVQALWAAIDQQFLRMERTLEALQQAVVGFGVDGNRNHEHLRNRVHEEARGHLGGERGPRPQ